MTGRGPRWWDAVSAGPRGRPSRVLAVLAAVVAVVAATAIAGWTLTAGGTAGSTRAAPPATAPPATAPPATTAPVPGPPAWQTAWTSPMDLLLKPYPEVAAVDTTVRDVATVAVSGTAVAIQLSNQWGPVPVTFGAATIGERAGTTGTGIVPGTLAAVTFPGGTPSVTVPAGADVTSLPVALAVQAGEALIVSLWVPGPAPVSVHYCCVDHIDAYLSPNGSGNLTLQTAPADAGGSWQIRWLSAVEVSGTPSQGTVVALGDSITDGYRDAGQAWPTALRQRIAGLPPDQQVAVVNEGITANTLTAFPSGDDARGQSYTYADLQGGQPGVTRLDRDALALPGTEDVLLLLGTNDIWFGWRDATPPYGSAPSIIAAMQQVIAATHAAGKRIIGVTLLPRATNSPACPADVCDEEVWTPSEQATLAAVDAWMVGPSTGFDAVIDLAAVMGDVYDGQCRPDLPFPPYFNNDNLHPDVAGEIAMADAIPTTLFGIPEAPLLPDPVTAIPTPGCPGAQQAEAVLAAAAAPASPPPTGSTPVPTQTSSPPVRQALYPGG